MKLEKLRQIRLPRKGNGQKIAQPIGQPMQISPALLRSASKERELLLYSSTFNGSFYLRLAQRIWSLLILSLPLDALLLSDYFYYKNIEGFTTAINYVLLILMLVGLAAMARERMIDIGVSLRDLQSKFSSSRAGSIIMIGVVVLVTVIEIVLQSGGFGVVALLIVGLFLLTGLPRLLKAYREKIERDLELQRDRILWVLQVNRQIFSLTIIPLLCVRGISIAGALKANLLTSPLPVFAAYLVLSLVLLSALKPAREQFITNCPRCLHWTSRALKNLSYCPACSLDKFLRTDLPSTPSNLKAGQLKGTTKYQPISATQK